ncbi:MAG: PhnD/SsuA/transferrin family substrate-binding protein [Thiotrichaceae bacterium]
MSKQTYYVLWLWSIIWLTTTQHVVFAEEIAQLTVQSSSNPPPAENALKIGVLALYGNEAGVKMWTATGEYLTQKVPPYTFEIVPLAFNEIHLAVRRRTIDFILTNPKFYMELESLYGLGRIATLNNKLSQGKSNSQFGGVIFTKSNRNDIRNYQDLKSKSFMAVDKLSFGGWDVALCELKHYQIGDVTQYFSSISFGGTHDAVVYAVRDGVVDVGAIRTDTLERMAADGKIKLEDFFILNARQYADFPLFISTELYPEWSFAKTQKVSDKLATQVSIALMQMTADDPAAIASKSVGWVVPHNYQKVEECMRELGGDARYLGNLSFNNGMTNNMLLSYWCWIIITLLVLILGIMIIMRD